jgi:hypothetical protein
MKPLSEGLLFWQQALWHRLHESRIGAGTANPSLTKRQIFMFRAPRAGSI